MNDLQPASGVLESSSTAASVAPSARAGLGTRVLRLLGQVVPTAMALGLVGGLVLLGQQTGWALPKFSVLLGRQQAEKDDWCAAHNVPDSECVECRKGCLLRGAEFGWCRTHGVHECPLCHPDVAQLPHTSVVSRDDLERAAQGLAFAPRVENNSKCKLHQQRIQFTSPEAVTRLGIEVAPAARGVVMEAVVANGEIVYDPTRVARLAARAPGTVRRVEKQLGDRVRRGDVLAVVDCAAAGRAKADFLQALTQRGLKARTVARLRGLAGQSVSMQSLRDAEAALEEARVRLLTAEQALLNLGLPVRTADLLNLPLEEVARRLQFLGLPDRLARSLDPRSASSNLIAVTAPLDGEVVERSVVAGEQAGPARVLFAVADTRQMWLMLNVRQEDANLLKPGLPVRFRHDGHARWDTGAVAWVSPGGDEKTRTVPVRVEFPNPDGRHHARTFGTAQVILRKEPRAVVVPNEAVHWEGDCNVVFVRDKRFDEPGVPKVFHVRSVRPGVKNGPNTEIIAGLLPGELVATRGSGILRSQLLKNNLGAG
jgi:cobalt-zinc-cadmium efflux system membrane fusion protein